MIKRITLFLLSRLVKNDSDLVDHHTLLLLSARRCAYDLKHAAGEIDPLSPFAEEFESRANNWLSIFAPDGIKNYRSELHRTIGELDLRNEQLERVLKENNIPLPYDDIPF